MHIVMSEKVENAQTRIEAYGNENIDDCNYVIAIYVRCRADDDTDDFTESMSFSFPISCNPFDMMYSVLDAMADNLNVKNVPYNAYWSCRKLAISLYRMRH